MNPWATRRPLQRRTWPCAFHFLVKINLCPTGFVAKLIISGPNTWCFLKDAYSRWRASYYWGHYGLALAASSMRGSDEEVIKVVTKDMTEMASLGEQGKGWAWARKVKISPWWLDLGCLAWGSKDEMVSLWGETLKKGWLAPGRGFLVICSKSLNPSGSLSAKALSPSNLWTLESASPMRGSGFSVKVSGAENTREEVGPAEMRVEKTWSSN